MKGERWQRRREGGGMVDAEGRGEGVVSEGGGVVGEGEGGVEGRGRGGGNEEGEGMVSRGGGLGRMTEIESRGEEGSGNRVTKDGEGGKQATGGRGRGMGERGRQRDKGGRRKREAEGQGGGEAQEGGRGLRVRGQGGGQGEGWVICHAIIDRRRVKWTPKHDPGLPGGAGKQDGRQAVTKDCEVVCTAAEQASKQTHCLPRQTFRLGVEVCRRAG